MKNILSSNRGITLIEILASIVILSIIALSFMSIFIQSARTNNFSENIIDATYVAQTNIEEVNFLSNSNSFDETLIELDSNYEEYKLGCESDYCFLKESNGFYVSTELNSSEQNDKLTNIIVKVFIDSTLSKQEAQMETIVKWEN